MQLFRAIFHAPVHATAALINTTAQNAAGLADAVAGVASAALDVATAPIRAGVELASGGASLASLTRPCWHGDGRAWIEVRGLAGPDGAELARDVLDAVTDRPGVTSAVLNRPLSRLVLEIDDTVSLPELCAAVDGAEKRHRSTGRSAGSGSLPGDGLALLASGAMVGLTAAGLGFAMAGRALRWPRAPIVVDAAAALANHQPWVRRLLADTLGTGPADAVLSLGTLAAHVVTLSPATLAVDLTMEALKAAELQAAAAAWTRHEPMLARFADQPDADPPARPAPSSATPAARHVRRMAYLQAIGTGLAGLVSRNITTAASAAVVTAPKALHVTRESFAATLGRGLAGGDNGTGVLALRPDSLRRLDEVDTLLIDPRVLRNADLRVVRVRGAADDELVAAWNRAQQLLDQPDLQPGWHRVRGITGRGRKPAIEALVLPALHPLATALVAEARRTVSEVVTVESDQLGELRPGFDDVRPVAGDHPGAVDDALAMAVGELHRAGRTVAVLSATATRALADADLALGLLPATGAPPFNADLLLADLAGAWRVLRALPAARTASERGIVLSAGASSVGALFLVPGVRGWRGFKPVTAGAAAGLMSGYLLARRVVRTEPPRPAPSYDWHAMTVEQVREVLARVTPDRDEPGRTARPARGAGAEWVQPVRQFARAVVAELSDPMTPVLALCSVATALLGSPLDAAMVGTALTGNAMLAAAQRLRAENRLNLLLEQQIPAARTVRTGPDGGYVYHDVVAERLRPGELIEVRSNEVVPADARLIEEKDLEVDESSLTGESLSVDKQVEATPGAELADRRCMLYAGTTVIAGTAVALVTAVGADTQTRRAAELASGDLPDIGLQYHLGQLVARAFPATAGGGVLVGVLGLVRGGGLRQALGNAIAVAVAALPEGMPLMATLAQHASAQRLTKTGALVRVPRSVEALGRIGVVCFDKTGTLSENRLRVSRVHTVSGHSRDDVLAAAAQAAPEPESAAHAHATDQAIIEAAAAAPGAAPWSQPDAHLPFRSGRAFSASVSGMQLTVKGAPEVVLAACADADADAADTVAAMAAEGLRVIAVAQRRLTAAQARSIQQEPDRIVDVCRSGLALSGFLGLADTPRPAAPKLLADLAERGVAIRMITGDHPITATAIAAELGVPVPAEQVITGSEWNSLSRKEQERAVSERVIFARMSPENKVQIVQTLERAGQVCAMVGDGANDAAAIRSATVGIGVVARGSDAAHTTADVVLTEGRIDALVDAIDEGRRLWRGVQAAVEGMLGGNAGEVIFSVIGTALTGNSPLNTRQLLLMNTLTDALPATAVAVSTPSGPVQRAGGRLDEGKLWRAVAVRGGITAAAGTAAWLMASVTGRPQRASTVALIALVCVELGQMLVDSQAPLVALTAAGSLAVFAVLITTPGLSQLLGCTPVGPLGWAQGLGAAAVATAAVAVTTRRGRSPAEPASPEPIPAGDGGPARPAPHQTARPARRTAPPAKPALTLVGSPE